MNKRIDGFKHASEMLQALEGRDEILGYGGDDVIIGGSGGDRIIGGAGRDRFVYETSRDLGDRIVDFTIGEDKIDLSQLLDSFNYLGNNPIDDGYLRLVQGTNGTSVQVDGDGSTGSSIFRPFIFLENVASNDLTLKDFII
jgi:Ca2+-binding RTX toxin-like protein